MTRKTIYFAGGCFWGTEHFFKQICGVLSTEAGFANGTLVNPSYAEVYTDKTGHAETVKVIYDPQRLPLRKLLRLFFMIIDPTSVNRQGEDVGTRYRTGIYYTDKTDLAQITEVCAKMEAVLGKELAVELLPLENYYPAEAYHQDYLGRNPNGYCHLPIKVFVYAKLLSDLELMLGDEPQAMARMSNIVAMLKERTGFFWAGFYLVGPAYEREGQELVLGPFQGPVACMRIAKGRGVCGNAWEKEETLLVPDVEKFPGHIACSALSRSEIVVPVFDKNGSMRAVLDVDSKELGTFDDTDKAWLEMLSELVYV